MSPGTIQIAEALLRLGWRAWEAHKAAGSERLQGLSDAEIAARIDGISIADADALIAEGAASAPTG